MLDRPRDAADLLRAWDDESAGGPPALLKVRTSPPGRAAERWSILAPWRPAAEIRTFADLRDAIAALGPPVRHAGWPPLPFALGLIGWIGYETGRTIEPAAAHHPDPRDSGWPLLRFGHCHAAIVINDETGATHLVGDSPGLAALLHRHAPTAAGSLGFTLGPLQSRTGQAAFEHAVARAIEYTHAGDIFQANIAHHLRGDFSGSPRALAAALLRTAAPWHGAYFEERSPAGHLRAIASASPELFLELDAQQRTLRTRPMKGTRLGGSGHADLAASVKDAAELNMIVDLMRNDLGRVARPAGVRVLNPRAFEDHAGGLVQSTATIEADLREGVDISEALAATFPGGSVTGAPKIRAMQIIEELEPHPRGPYCGAMGFICRSGNAAFNIAIRSALIDGPTDAATDQGPRITRGSLTYPVGAGIVADSDPRAEWHETLDKARPILALVNR